MAESLKKILQTFAMKDKILTVLEFSQEHFRLKKIP